MLLNPAWTVGRCSDSPTAAGKPQIQCDWEVSPELMANLVYYIVGCGNVRMQATSTDRKTLLCSKARRPSFPPSYPPPPVKCSNAVDHFGRQQQQSSLDRRLQLDYLLGRPLLKERREREREVAEQRKQLSVRRPGPKRTLMSYCHVRRTWKGSLCT